MYTELDEKTTSGTRSAKSSSSVTHSLLARSQLPAWTAAWRDRPPATLFLPQAAIQTKLTVSQPGDPYEQEADRAAEQVMRMPDSQAATLQRAATNPVAVDGASPIVHDALNAPGQPLDAATRASFEPRFGQDFNHVRVHNDARAAESARAVNAVAYTVGRDVVFSAGQYAPETEAGRRLLAHELTHVIQQSVPGIKPQLQRTFRLTDLLTSTGAVRVSNPIATNPDTYFYPGSSRNPTGRRALVIAGIHGSEPSARNLGQEVEAQLASGAQQPDFHTIVIPQVNPHPTGIRGAGSGATSVTDLNREFGTGYPSPSPYAQRVTTIIAEFDPERILSIHAISNPVLGGVFLDPIHARATPRPGETGRQVDIRSYPPVSTPAERATAFMGDPRNLAAMQLTEAMIRQVQGAGGTTPGNVPVTSRPGSQYPTGAGVTAPASPFSLIYPLQGSMTGGVSLGTWASGYGRTVITIEIPGYSAAATVWRGYLPAVWEFLRIPVPASTTPSSTSTSSSPLQSATAPSTTSEPQLQRQVDPNTQSQPTEADQEPHEDAVSGESILRWLMRLLREIIRVLEQWGTMPEPLPHEAAPANLPSGCRTFADQAALDVRKAHWTGVISSMAMPDVISWIVGVSAPPAAAAAEAEQQKDCMLTAIRAAAGRTGSSIHLPSGNLTRSGRRSFASQRGIWERKFEFRGTPFDRISAHARTVCGSLITSSETRWDPSNPRHRVCWNVAPLPGTTAPPMPSGTRALTDDERQAEILQASSAPGVSRHHWGTDFDLFDPDMNPALWQAGGPFADEYSWMMRNASTYGFIQPFTATSTFMRLGYIEERWHWSYYPIAQALLEFARAHQSDIETRLLREWGTNPQFSYIRRHWREYMFNVSESAIF